MGTFRNDGGLRDLRQAYPKFGESGNPPWSIGQAMIKDGDKDCPFAEKSGDTISSIGRHSYRHGDVCGPVKEVRLSYFHKEGAKIRDTLGIVVRVPSNYVEKMDVWVNLCNGARRWSFNKPVFPGNTIKFDLTGEQV